MNRLQYFMAFSCLLGIATLSGCQPKHKAADQVFENLVYTITREEIKHSPELGAKFEDKIKSFSDAQSHSLDDRSTASASEIQVTRLEELQSLSAINKDLLSPTQKNTYDTLEILLTNSARFSTFVFGETDLFSTRPYVITHLDGAYLELPNFLTHSHPINSLRDAQEYVERLSSVANAIDDEIDRFSLDVKKGITPPDFILDQIITNAQLIYNAPTENSSFVTTLQYGLEYLEDLDVKAGQSLLNQAKLALEDQIRPAYQRLIDTVTQAKSGMSGPIGLSAIKDGKNYYQALLNTYPSQTKTPQEIHDIGLNLVAEISSELDLMLINQELSDGAVAERLIQLGTPPEYLFENTQEGHQQFLQMLDMHISSMEEKLSQAFSTYPSASNDIEALTAQLMHSTPENFYQSPPTQLEETTTSSDELPTASTAPQYVFSGPIWSLATFSYHETIPGRLLQNAIRQTIETPPLLQLASFPTYVEGWDLYAEDLADEMGIYADAPLDRIGYLQSLLFQAARLVVDTGIHDQNWSREQATQYLVDTTGYSYALMQTEVDQYIVHPTLACAAILGRNEIRRLRKQADQALGNKFNLKAFHDVLLTNGARPLSVVETDITDWISEQSQIIQE